MSKILVTGAQGFIGSALVKYYSHKGEDVVGWGRRRSEGAIEGFREVDMSNLSEVEDALQADSPDLILHCAGCANVAESVQFPDRDFRGSVLLLHNLLTAMHKLHMERVRVVFLSSAAVYGNPASLPIAEDAALNPLSPYAMHKILCEDICAFYRAQYGFDIRVARIFSAYGRGLKKQIFWDLYKKWEKTGRLELFGTGAESRDYIHIDDLVRAIEMIAITDSSGTVYNVANGKDVSIREAAECLAECVGTDANQIFFNGKVREGDPLNWRADVRSLEHLGYRQTVQLRDGLMDYVRWIEGKE